MNKATAYWRSEYGRATIYLGDCREVLAKLDPEQFHTVVTDPPYGLEFMGMEFDAPWKHQLIDPSAKIETCDEGTDKSHPFRDGTQRVNYGNKRTRKVDAKDRRAGEMGDPVKAKYLRHNVEYVRDAHLYQEWFQTCAEAMIRVAKPGAHLLSFGGTRMWHRMACAIEDAGWDIRDTLGWVYMNGFPKSHDISKAIDKMHGFTRKDTSDTGSATRNGDGTIYGLNHSGHTTSDRPITKDAEIWGGWGTALKPSFEPIIMARRPLDGTAIQNSLEHGCGGLNVDACRVGDSGGTTSVGEPNRLNSVYGDGMGGLGIVDAGKGRWPANLLLDGSAEVMAVFPPDGGASRMFYCPKADDKDRPHSKGGTQHPTVKPLDLMCYLVRLVCPRGGTVLDPFTGSGSTGVAALAEGMRFVGIEQDKEYADIAVGRLKLALESAPQAVQLTTRAPVSANGDVPPPSKKFRLK